MVSTRKTVPLYTIISLCCPQGRLEKVTRPPATEIALSQSSYGILYGYFDPVKMVSWL